MEEIATHHGDCPSVAYRIADKGVVLVFSGDMDASAVPNLVRLAKNADLLIFNCAVLDPPDSPSQFYDLHTPPRTDRGSCARERGKEFAAEPSCSGRRKEGGCGAEIDSGVLRRAGRLRERYGARPRREVNGKF